ncbi:MULTISPECIES: cytochrome P450 [Actinomadura]|uniref:Cytochrome P450 n=1 Tax=Actinomadura litoris TaxID=2678616 RepID=A0A7K1KU43_9ACTN|nr:MULTISPECIES: cytochrome P450 [Actinomadura]MBT2207475.1 cytochrome P450 [Actinomadura sp. NEAU-AAG7]MUN35714.1 cytochrome P450 [Actinomadura litoris]
MTSAETASCPVHQNFDPLEETYLADPYPTMSAVRAEVPVFYSPEVDMWVVTRYGDIESVFKDPGSYSASIGQRPVFPLTDEAREIVRGGFHATPVMSDCDPPRHTRIRKHNMKGFSARRTAVLEPKVWAKATELVDAIEPGRVDLVSAVTYPLPAYMIFTFIGFPDADMDMLKRWCGNRMLFSWGRPSPEEQKDIAGNMVRYWRYCEEFVADRAKNPRDDFTSDLVRIHRDDPEAVSLEEIVNVAYGLSFAGHETTTNYTSNIIRRLLTHRSQWEDVCADRELVTDAIEEGLRYDSSIIAWRRITTRPVTLGGVDIPEGGKIMLLLGAANRDPEVFHAPESFDIHRDDSRSHLAFGKGIHFCLGAALARMEARIVLELLAERAPGMTLVEEQEYTFPANISFRGPRRLLVDWPAAT